MALKSAQNARVSFKLRISLDFALLDHRLLPLIERSLIILRHGPFDIALPLETE